MNNRQPNRRRGRGNNNRAPNNNRNGFDNANRIDNRARGNASQMLEKYKKLAQDAQHIGDRVNGEYYLQFADHYFRVLADFRSRQEEGRPQREWRGDERDAGEDWRDDERDTQSEGEETEVTAEAGNEDEDYRRPQRQERNERPERNDRPERPDRNARGRNSNNGNNNNRRDRYEPREERAVPEDAGLDLSILPPSIAIANDAEEVAEEKPARKPRARRPKSANDEDVVTAAE
jgi:Domain of unknown function (DUF4167)